MAKLYPIKLTEPEREQLRALTTKGNQASAMSQRRTRTLLLADAGRSDQAIAEALQIARTTVERTRRRATEEGVTAALQRRPQRSPSQRPKLDGEKEAHLVALVCSEPPPGHSQWSLRLLADRLVELKIVESASHELGRRPLEKNGLKPWLKPVQWCIPPEQSAAFVACREDTREVYTRPFDARCPQVCLDAKGLQRVSDTRAPLPAGPARRAKEDFEYARAGAANGFMLYEPLAGVRPALMRERRTAVDFAWVIKTLCDETYPQAEKIVLVMDQLNTHNVASLYAAFPPAEARRLARRLAVHPSPKHGSWLNMAEIALSVLTRQCLRRRVPSQKVLNPRGGRLAASPQRRCHQDRLALHHGGCPHQTRTPLSCNSTVIDY